MTRFGLRHGVLRSGRTPPVPHAQRPAAAPGPPAQLARGFRATAARARRTVAPLALALSLLAGGPGHGAAPAAVQDNPAYDGRFTFTRIRYGPAPGAWGFRRGGAWAHDYPRADRHLSRIVAELTTAPDTLAGTNVLTLDDPDLFRHPVAYVSEPGFWSMSDAEVRRLREYVLKGGFLILDDFEREQWHNMEEQLRRALPEHRLIRIDVDHPIFHVFFDMQDIYFPHPLVRVTPTYYGLFEDNDPAGRMLAIVNYDNDIAEYWEWSDTGWLPIDFTNDAYKLGVNYVVWALTH